MLTCTKCGKQVDKFPKGKNYCSECRKQYRRSTPGMFVSEMLPRVKGQSPPGFDLDKEWMLAKINGKCEVTGLPFNIKDKRSPYAPSLDRIKPGGPYSKENTRMVVWAYNAFKGTWTDDDCLEIARALIGQKEIK